MSGPREEMATLSLVHETSSTGWNEKRVIIEPLGGRAVLACPDVFPGVFVLSARDVAALTAILKAYTSPEGTGS